MFLFFFILLICTPSLLFVYLQTETIDLTKNSEKSGKVLEIFAKSNCPDQNTELDADGLPYVGQVGLLFGVYIYIYI